MEKVSLVPLHKRCDPAMKLYDYFRSTACYRVRIALNLKKTAYETLEVHLVNNGGEQLSTAYRQVNPQGLVPALLDDDRIITQSLAIIEYLNEKIPQPALLPDTADERAQVRSLAQIMACDIHPLNNLRVLKQLRSQFAASEDDITQWYHHWLKEGFDAVESRLQNASRSFPVCHGSDVSLADICLVPQVYNARRFHFNMDNYPRINEIDAHCQTMSAFRQAAPEI